MSTIRVRGWLAWAVLINAVPAVAQEATPVPAVPRFHLQRAFLNPTLGPGLMVPTAESLSKRMLVAGGYLGYEKSPLVFFRGQFRSGELIADKLSLRGTVAYGVNDGLMIAAEGTLFAHQKGEALGLDEVRLARWSIGGFRFSARAQLLSQGATGLLRWAMPIDLAVGLLWSPPLGTDWGFIKEGPLYLEPHVSVGRAFAAVRIGGEVAVAVRGRSGNELMLKAVIATTQDWLRYELAALATVPLKPVREAVGIEVLAALRTRVGPVEFFATGGPGFGRLVGTPQLRVLGGAAWRPEPKSGTPGF